MRADAQRPPLPGGEVCRTTERAGAHSLQFGTYALWAAGLLAALAVRPVPSCTVSLARCVNDQAPNDVRPGQVACSCVRSMMTWGPDHQYPAKSGELPWNTLHARSAADAVGPGAAALHSYARSAARIGTLPRAVGVGGGRSRGVCRRERVRFCPWARCAGRASGS